MKTSKVIIDEDTLSAYHFDWEYQDFSGENKIYSVKFKLYDISWVSYNCKTGEENYPSYHNLESHHIDSDHEPSEETKPKIEGHIKWDGCCNYQYNEEAYLHMCGLNGFKSEYKQMKRVYKECIEIMGDTVDLDCMGLEDEEK